MCQCVTDCKLSLSFCLIYELFPLKKQKRTGIDEKSNPSPSGGGLLDCVSLAVAVRPYVGPVAMDLYYCHGLFSDKRE